MSETNGERLERIKGDLGYATRGGIIGHGWKNSIEWLIEQAERTQSVEEENARLRMQYENTGTVMNRMQARTLHEENKRLRKALAFYAEEGNYYTPIPHADPNEHVGAFDAINEDRGKIAKTALEGEQ